MKNGQVNIGTELAVLQKLIENSSYQLSPFEVMGLISQNKRLMTEIKRLREKRHRQRISYRHLQKAYEGLLRLRSSGIGPSLNGATQQLMTDSEKTVTS